MSENTANKSVGVIGLGYVGLPLVVAFARAGFEVVGVDIDRARIDSLKAGKSHVDDVSDHELQEIGARFLPTTSPSELTKCDAVLICVPTPLTRHREPDLTPLTETATALTPVIQPQQLIILESTTFPGTTRDLLRNQLELSGLTAGEDFHLAFSPERVDPGRSDFTLANTPKIVGGLTPQCLERATALYSEICKEIVPVSSPEAAELTKLLENIFRSVNIALVNELAIVADRMGIDIWEVVDAAATKPFGFMRFDPGPGMGGHCLPVDPFYLAWKAREFDLSTEFIELAGKVNQRMPYFCVEKIERALNDLSKSVRDSNVLIVGVSYKGGVGDLRESPALKIIELLKSRGAKISYHDPHVPQLEQFGLTSMDLADSLTSCDVGVIVTAHPSVDHNLIATRAPAVVDLRGVVRNVAEVREPALA